MFPIFKIINKNKNLLKLRREHLWRRGGSVDLQLNAQEIYHYLNNGWVTQHVAQQITTEIVEVCF